MAPNKTFVFKKVPSGMPVAGEHIAIEDRPLDIETAPPGGLVVKINYASLDPYLRSRMRPAHVRSYLPAFEPGDPVVNATVATVLKSDCAEYAEGDQLVALLPIAEYARVEDVGSQNTRKIVNPHGLDPALFIGPLGLAGSTAWAGLYQIGKPKKGEVLVVSSAAGSVGQIAGQLGKREGLTVIGSAGSDEKVEFLTGELGFDAAFNYKKERPLDAIKRLAPNGIDICFENVGAEHLDAAIRNMNPFGRVIMCGAIADYQKPVEERTGIKSMSDVVYKSLTIRGFIEFHPGFGPDIAEDLHSKMPEWLRDGSVKMKLHVTEGIDKAMDAFFDLFEGKNFGKAVLKI